MSQTLRDFIASQEGEVTAHIKALNDALGDLRAAKSAIDGSSATGAERAPSGRVTHRDMIVAVLDDRPEGGTSDKVIEWVNDKFNVEISQASLSSQLSRAKSDRVVSLDTSTKVWRSSKHSEVSGGLSTATPQDENSEPAGSEEAKSDLNQAPAAAGPVSGQRSPPHARDTF